MGPVQFRRGRAPRVESAREAAGSKLPEGRRVLVFSPPPDDDVISMAGSCTS